MDNKENAVMVSVHMIAYKHENFIAKAIEGVINQKTNFSIELIVSDDCSPDKTGSIIENYRTKYPNIIKPVLRSQNMGMMKNFADTFRHCSGKYIAICEGDDFWTDPLKLQRQVDFLETNEDYVMCFHNAKVVNLETGKAKVFLNQDKARAYTGSEILSDWTVPTASVVFRNHCFSIAELENLNYKNGDIILFLSIAEHGKIWYLNEVMSEYNRHTGGVSYARKARADREKYILHYKEIAKNFGGKYKQESQSLIGLQYMHMSLLDLKSLSFHFFPDLGKSFQSLPQKFFYNLKTVYLKPLLARLLTQR